ncbi:hypothetical protein C1S99_11985 [Vibrio parahaemolyticus]|nr:hypothetical protein C1T12_12470 [Vibrio parahaemolyticus]QLK44802.1 hypothetical protein DR996_05475 [Vibrio owensii]PMS63044.1 hypothetical protein C1S91_11365 [Vibrio parahaemolyticus]PMS68981.1 hypothetical protein C1S96_07555 [Vibrio parahaemolyticus]PMS73617.1 hypothetical protein C1T10_11600 [Vibrio parahaemolyticus]
MTLLFEVKHLIRCFRDKYCLQSVVSNSPIFAVLCQYPIAQAPKVKINESIEEQSLETNRDKTLQARLYLTPILESMAKINF